MILLCQTANDSGVLWMIAPDKIHEAPGQPGEQRSMKKAIGERVVPGHRLDVHIENHITKTKRHDNQLPVDGGVPDNVTVKSVTLNEWNPVAPEIFSQEWKLLLYVAAL